MEWKLQPREPDELRDCENGYYYVADIGALVKMEIVSTVALAL